MIDHDFGHGRLFKHRLNRLERFKEHLHGAFFERRELIGMAPCRFVWKATLSLGHRRRERAGRQVLELGHAQVG
ncbi:hypothetical protein, partial [Ralstonia pickettii]|uniref:hypothetical protein n=1 Tax=Ralstonia pickettii TaxID=329 RepID=UPI00292E2E6C